jgi:hypothetical protein
VAECDREVSTVKRPWSIRGGCAIRKPKKKKKNSNNNNKIKNKNNMDLRTEILVTKYRF